MVNGLVRTPARPTFHLQFVRYLEDYPWYREYREAGSVAFHRWLPNGELDGLILPIKWRGELRVWFERFGYADESGIIRFDRKRREVDETALNRQAVVFSGPLFGHLSMEVEKIDLEAVRKGTALYEEHQKSGNAPISYDYYTDFGKVVAEILGPPLESFFDLLRFNYGQYWVKSFRRWDSRFQNLGSFFGAILATWSEDEESWHDFRPTARQEIVRVQAIPWQQFLTEQDWRDLGDAFLRGVETKPAMVILSRANRFLDDKEIGIALVEAVTALELAVSSLLVRRLDRSGISEVDKLEKLPLDEQIKVVLAILEPPIEPVRAREALEGVKLRNDFVHEGKIPEQSAARNVKSLMLIVSRLVEPPGPKFPVYALGSGGLLPV